MVRKYGPERAELIGRTDRVLLIFPNLVILDIMGVVVRTITPTSAGHTKVTQWSLASAGEDADLRARRLENFITFQGPGGLATPDDLEAFEACQAGLRTGGRRAVVGHLPRHAPRAPRPAQPRRRRAADARILATVAGPHEPGVEPRMTGIAGPAAGGTSPAVG